MPAFLLRSVFLWAVWTCSHTQTPEPEPEPATGLKKNILVLLDSSGSLSDFEFSQLLLFTSKLLRPLSLDNGNVKVGLLQVGTSPHLEFGLEAHKSQESLQEALQAVRHLRGNTNTVEALMLAQRLLSETEEEVPKILLWLTDGAQPGDVTQAMTELKTQGVTVMIVATTHANYHLLQQAVTPPLESNLYSVDMDDVDIITEDLRKAIIKSFHAESLHVNQLTAQSAVLQWSPVLEAAGDFYDLRYNSMSKADTVTRRTLPGDSSSVRLTDLQPDTVYTASLKPESNQRLFNTLSVTFTTLPDILSPAVVTVSDSGPHQMRVHWGPLQPERIQRHKVEYGAFPSGSVQVVTLHGRKKSMLLTGLEAGTEYLITVSAVYADGRERAMSLRACTKEVLPALVELQLTTVEHQEVQVVWTAHQDGLKGFWLKWDRKSSKSPSPNSYSSSIYLSPATHSMRLRDVRPGGRVCVSPVYSSGLGDGLCCTANNHTDSSQ